MGRRQHVSTGLPTVRPHGRARLLSAAEDEEGEVMAADDIANIECRSGVNDRDQGFITVVVVTGDERMLLGQLDPATARQLGMQFLEVAEAAEQDAAVMRVIHKLELPEELAGAVIAELRDSR
jgi:hypothetical protein